MERREFFSPSGGTSARPISTRSQLSQPIDAQLRKAIEDRAILGVVAMAADRDGVLYGGAFGLADSDSARPMTADALFRIASMTKAITSVAALQSPRRHHRRRTGRDRARRRGV